MNLVCLGLMKAGWKDITKESIAQFLVENSSLTTWEIMD
jgi:hypothetical protein